MKTRVLVAAIALAGVILFGTPPLELASPVALEHETDVATIPVPDNRTPQSISALPTVTPPRETPPVRAGYAAASLPTTLPASLPTPLPASLPARESVTLHSTLPTVTPELEPVALDRSKCDPAYPDPETCIPPGPPFDQGCAITSERRFTVLPPDPQGLDHDNDGIGCEPIRRRT